MQYILYCRKRPFCETKIVARSGVNYTKVRWLLFRRDVCSKLTQYNICIICCLFDDGVIAVGILDSSFGSFGKSDIFLQIVLLFFPP